MLTSEYYGGNNPFGLAKGLGTRPPLASGAAGTGGGLFADAEVNQGLVQQLVADFAKSHRADHLAGPFAFQF